MRFLKQVSWVKVSLCTSHRDYITLIRISKCGDQEKKIKIKIEFESKHQNYNSFRNVISADNFYNNLQVYASQEDQIMCNNFNVILLKGYVNYVDNMKNNYLLYFCSHWPVSEFFLFPKIKSAAGNVVKVKSCCQSKDAASNCCLGKRCQRQPSANHICVWTRLIDT